MQVILIRDVASVGKQGDVVNVADGYARNYLFPRNLATKADKGALKALEAHRALEHRKGEKHLVSAQDTGSKLHNSTIVIEGKAAKGSTKLYGAITHQDIADAIKDQLKIEVDKRRIMLENPVKSLGTYRVPIRLHTQVVADVRLVVIGEGEEVPPLEPISEAEAPAPETAEAAAPLEASAEAAVVESAQPAEPAESEAAVEPPAEAVAEAPAEVAHEAVAETAESQEPEPPAEDQEEQA